MSNNTTAQPGELHSIATKQANEQQTNRADHYINIPEKQFLNFVGQRPQAGFFQPHEEYLHDLTDDESQVYVTIYYNEEINAPQYYVYSGTLQRFYTCKDFKDLALLVASLEMYLQMEIEKRIIEASRNLPKRQ